MDELDLKVGDRIRDVEDGDFFYEGFVVSLNPMMYKVDRVFLVDDHPDDSLIGQITEPLLWYVKKMN